MPNPQVQLALGPDPSHSPAMEVRLPLSLRRRLRRMEARVRGERAVVVYSADYNLDFPGVPVDGLRGERILTALVREGLVGRGAVIRPSEAAVAKLERVHESAYLERLASPEIVEATFGVSLPPVLAERAVELQRCMVGGTLEAALAAWRQHKLAINLGGGFHHAHRARGEGFCLLNDIAVAIAELRARGYSEAITIVDLDLHDGDGTRALFADDPSVWTFSIHNAHWGPTEAVSSTAIALGEGVGDRDYLACIRTHLPRVLERHRPGLVFYLAGCDPAADDRMGNWEISEAGMCERDAYVLAQLRERGIESVVWLLGGGYGSDAWRHSAASLIAALGGPAHPRLPSTEAITLSRFRDLAGVLDPAELSGSPPGALEFSEHDLAGAGADLGAGLGPPKILDYYTPHGVEVALEGYGLLTRIRQLGFDPRVELDHHPESGDTVRVWGGADDADLLMEVRLVLDRLTVPGMELLRIEWLLLQNPRASWTAGRAPLPGQRHPGLHMFDDVAILMLMICERLRLDGIVVVPSHYHVAARWHGRMRFLDPAVEGRFQALRALLDGHRLDEASAAVEHGRVVDLSAGAGGGGGPSYRPAPLVLAASAALERRFDEGWARAVEEARSSARFELRPRARLQTPE